MRLKQNYAGQCDVSGWRDIVAVAAGKFHTVGLKRDGTVVAVGWNYSDPETAVAGAAFHAFEWLFVRLAPLVLIGAVIGLVLTRNNA